MCITGIAFFTWSAYDPPAVVVVYLPLVPFSRLLVAVSMASVASSAASLRFLVKLWHSSHSSSSMLFAEIAVAVMWLATYVYQFFQYVYY